MSRRVLLIGDNPSDGAAILDALVHTGGTPFPLERVGLLSAALERLSRDRTRHTNASDRIAAIIVDLSLPDSNGIATFDQLFQATPHIPILVIATSHDEHIGRLAVRHGAQGYLLKPRLDGYTLCRALESMVERAAAADAQFAQRELAEFTLNSLGDAVISVNFGGEVTYLNAQAEAMTGWRRDEAIARPLADVLHIVDSATRIPVPNPLLVAMIENKASRLTADCILIRRDGSEAGIDDSAAPIHDRNGQVTGAVMVFHDVTQARAVASRTAYLAQHDALSGLANRVLLNDRLSYAITAAKRHS